MLKKKDKFIVITLLLASALLLGACRGSAPTAAAPTPLPVTQSADSGSSAPRSGFGIEVEGRVVPDSSLNLSFKATGQVAEVLVQEGDLVKTGDVIARLGDREVLEANLANAQQAHVSAQLELTDANLALLEAQKAYDDLYERWPELAIQAEQTLTDARQAARDASRSLSIKSTTADQLDIDIAYTQVVLSGKSPRRRQGRFRALCQSIRR